MSVILFYILVAITFILVCVHSFLNDRYTASLCSGISSLGCFIMSINAPDMTIAKSIEKVLPFLYRGIPLMIENVAVLAFGFFGVLVAVKYGFLLQFWFAYRDKDFCLFLDIIMYSIIVFVIDYLMMSPVLTAMGVL